MPSQPSLRRRGSVAAVCGRQDAPAEAAADTGMSASCCLTVDCEQCVCTCTSRRVLSRESEHRCDCSMQSAHDQEMKPAFCCVEKLETPNFLSWIYDADEEHPRTTRHSRCGTHSPPSRAYRTHYSRQQNATAFVHHSVYCPPYHVLSFRHAHPICHFITRG